MNGYIPGVCNIGPAEIENRKKFGMLSATVAVVLGIFLFFLGIPEIVRVVVFFPLFLSAIGFLQARLHFCAEFGMLGVFNFSDKLRNTETVDQKEFRRKDQMKAIEIIGLSLMIAGVITYIFVQL